MLSHLTADGQVDAAGAAAGFDAAFGSSGTGLDVLDGSGPLRWASSTFNELSADEQGAVSGVLAALPDPFRVAGDTPPAGQGTTDTIPGDTAPRPTGRHLHHPARPRTVPIVAGDCVRFESGSPLDPVPVALANAASTLIAMDDEFTSRLGRSAVPKLGLCLFASTTAASAVAGLVFGADGDRSTPADHCVVYVNDSSGASLEAAQLAIRIGYSLFQCYIATAVRGASVASFYAVSGAWYIEGAAMWATAVAATAVAGGTSTALDDFWDTYLTTPKTALTGRLYDALGWFAQVQSAEMMLWTRLDGVLASRSTAEAWAAALEGSKLADTWPSGYFRDSTRTDWDIVGPSITSASSQLAVQIVANDGTATVDAAILAVGPAKLQATADVLNVAATGKLRISDGSIDLQRVTGQYFCTKSDHMCTCPAHTKPLVDNPQPLDSSIDVALVGGLQAATATFSGLSMDEFCQPERTVPPDPCTLVTQSEAATASGTPVESGLNSSVDLVGLSSGTSCIFRVANSDVPVAHVRLDVIDLGSNPAVAFAGWKAYTGFAGGPIPGLGDENFFFDAPGLVNVFIRTGNIMLGINVLTADGLAQATVLAKLILARMS